jgi:hypothetical protein
MATFKVVVIDVELDISPGFLDVGPSREVGLLILEASKPTLNHDVIGPATLAVHALSDSVFRKEGFILGTGKLTSLIRIKDIRLGNPEGFLAGLYACSRIKRIIQLPADYVAAMPVDDGCQIEKSMLYWNVCDIDRPGLVRSRNYRNR